MTAIGQYREWVTLEEAGPPVPDGDGGYVVAPVPLAPPLWKCAIQPATVRDLEQIGSGTVTAQATHIVRGLYHPGITTQTTVRLGAHVLSVVSVVNRDLRNLETILVCAEVVA